MYEYCLVFVLCHKKSLSEIFTSFFKKKKVDINWLTYSHLSKGAFCKVCVLFRPKVGEIEGQKLEVLKETPFVKYKDALYDLKKHLEREYHKTATLRSFEFIKCFESKQQTIEVQLDNQLHKTIEENKKTRFP